MKTNKQLRLAFDFIQYTRQNIFLTGKAGTGKTTFLRTLKERSPKRMIVVAPTGVAAINAGGVTVHSFFQLSFAPQIGTELKQNNQKRFTKQKINILRNLDLLVIDEISMVRADVLDAIDRVMRRFKDRRKPFGGAQVLMIGDLQQLAPVVKNEEWGLLRHEYKTPYFFSSKVLNEFPYVGIELTEVFRQQDEKFISLLNKVRDNEINQDVLETLNKRYQPGFTPKDDEGYITLCTHNISAQQINDSKLFALPGKNKIYQAEIGGKFPDYSYPTNFELRLKIGAQVMFVKNDPGPEKRFYNGKIGHVTKLNDDSVFVQCTGDDDEIEVSPLTWENIKYSINKETSEIKEELEGSFKQIPLKTAWAITIHKSQGLTFEKAIIDAEASFAHGQVYVALSRCKTLDGLVLSSPIKNSSIVNDQAVGGFIRQVEENQPGEHELNKARLDFQNEILIDLFSFYRIVYLVNEVNKLAIENKGSFPEILITLFKEMKSQVAGEITEVSEKFRKRIEHYLVNNPDIEKNTSLLERIKKAAAWFSTKINDTILENLKNVDLDIDNRALKKQLNRLTNDLTEEVETKLSGFKECAEGFSVKRILDARAKSMLASTSKTPGKPKAVEITNLKKIPHPELYNELRTFRNEKANESDIPAYMIFSQKSLVELVNYLPVDSKTLQLINGFGARKIEQFGADIIHIILHYCNENNIERGTIPLKEAPRKEKKPKPDTKKISLELFQNGKTIEQIANERALSTGTIEGHLAHFVKLGEIDVSRLIEKNKLEKITAYFSNNEDKSFGTAKTHFGNDVSYGELRIALSYLESLTNK